METNQTGPETGSAPDDVKGDSAATSGPAAGAVGSAPPAAPQENGESGDGFFGWLRRLGVPRRPGWLGGVSAGVAARLGIDPIIVRGIIVVAAVLGAPFVLLYAVAWLLLPDTDGRIHLERLLRGAVDPPVVGIAVMGVIGLIPLVQGGWLGWRWWPDVPSLADPIFGFNLTLPLRVLWVLALIAGVVVLVVWLIRRASQTSPGGGTGADSRMASASAAAVPGNPPAPSATTDAAAGPAASVTFASSASTIPVGTTGEPPAPALGADAAEIAEWRTQREAWRRSHAEWRQSQQDAERAARTRAAVENKAKAQALAAESEEARRIRRAERPRASAAYVFTVLGIALVSATLAAFWALGSADFSGYAVAVALAVGVIVLAAGMFVAAVSRRRSGLLAFVTALTTVIMLGAASAPSSSVVPPSYGIPMLESHSVVQPVGDAYFTAYAAVRDAPGMPEVHLTQWMGDVYLTVLDDVRVVLDASEAGRVEVVERSADRSVDVRSDYGDADGIHTFGGEPGQAADARLIVRQQVGTIYVTIDEGAAR